LINSIHNGHVYTVSDVKISNVKEKDKMAEIMIIFWNFHFYSPLQLPPPSQSFHHLGFKIPYCTLWYTVPNNLGIHYCTKVLAIT
jgi:hypothetical protein